MKTWIGWSGSRRSAHALSALVSALLIGSAAFQADAHIEYRSVWSTLPLPSIGLPVEPLNASLAADPLPDLPELQRPAAPAAAPVSETARLRIQEGYGRIPMHFEPNLGQTAEEVRFLARGPGYTLFLTDEEAVLVLRKGKAGPPPRERLGKDSRRHPRSPDEAIAQSGSEPNQPQGAVVRMRLEGATRNASP